MSDPCISVVVCSHNPRPDYFARSLQGLKDQLLPTGQWELLVVDNRSNTPLADGLDLRWHPHSRVIREDVLGLTPARLRGIRESRGELLVFVDDDNVLDADFLSNALQTARDRPFLGAWSGQCHGVFEQDPPAWTRRYWGNLVIREFEDDRWSNLPRLAETMPCGAGLCIRRSAALHYLHLTESGRRSFQLDRTGDSLISGGDNDLAACACDLGMGVGLVAALRLQHLIPPERLTCDYLAKLAEGIYFSSTILDHARGIPVIKRSVCRRVLALIRLATLSKADRSVQVAAIRGRERAMVMILEKSR